MCRLQAFTRIRAHASSKQTFVKLTVEALPSIKHWEDFIFIFLCDIQQITQGKSRKQKSAFQKTKHLQEQALQFSKRPPFTKEKIHAVRHPSTTLQKSTQCFMIRSPLFKTHSNYCKVLSC